MAEAEARDRELLRLSSGERVLYVKKEFFDSDEEPIVLQRMVVVAGTPSAMCATSPWRS
jgi:hypothetical protein